LGTVIEQTPTVRDDGSVQFEYTPRHFGFAGWDTHEPDGRQKYPVTIAQSRVTTVSVLPGRVAVTEAFMPPEKGTREQLAPTDRRVVVRFLQFSTVPLAE
jgi:hypothetical protein